MGAGRRAEGNRPRSSPTIDGHTPCWRRPSSSLPLSFGARQEGKEKGALAGVSCAFWKGRERREGGACALFRAKTTKKRNA
jgi:hypothetical protein